MNLLRPILALAVIAAAIAFSGKYAEHHRSDNPFQQLYTHLMPANLVQHAAHVDEGEDHGAAETDEHGVGEKGAVAEVSDPSELEAEHGEGGAGGHAASPLLFALPLPGFIGTTFAGAGNLAAGILGWAPEWAETYRYEVSHHDGTHGYAIPLTNLQVYQIASVLLIFVLLGGIPGYVRTGRGDFLTKMFTGFAMWIRDEMVVPVMGRQTGAKYAPYFLSVFFFILFMNLMGLLPGGATATASIYITGALAVTTLFSMVICGMVVQGPIAFWKNLVPHVPLALWPLMFFVELIGLMVKPFALMVRLFANMTGGHMVVLSFMGLIFFFATSIGPGVGWASSPVAVAFAVFIMIIEAFVAMLQAYIFTQLSIIFVNASIHPEH